MAATVTPIVRIGFNGSLSGTAYTLGAGELDTTGTFVANGTPTLSGGMASLDGVATGGHDGFKFNPTTLGNLTTQNWLVEAVISFDTFTSGGTVIDVLGDTDFRLTLPNPTALQAVYWDGANEGSIAAVLPAANTLRHYALVWDAAGTRLSAYVNGVLIGSADNGAFSVADATNISFGYFGRATFANRGVDGSLDAVAFSTFTGSFDAGSNFVIPEASSLLLGILGGLPLLRRRRI